MARLRAALADGVRAVLGAWGFVLMMRGALLPVAWEVVRGVFRRQGDGS